MAKTKVIRTNANKRRSETEGCAAPKKRSFVFFDFFSLSNTKRLKMKAFLVVSLVSLRDRSRLREKPPKESSFVLLSFFFTFECKKIENESISGSKFSLLTLRARTVFKNFSKNAGNFAILVCWAATK